MPIELSVETDEEKAATKTIRDLLGQFREVQALLSTMSKKVRPPKICAKLGDINPAIYQNGAHTQQDPLSSLPAEVQRMVNSYLVYPADRLMLALTCKSQAAVFEDIKQSAKRTAQSTYAAKLTASSSGKAKSSSASKTRRTPTPTKALTKADRLHVLIRLEPWMKGYRLCCDCLRYIPKGKSKRKMAPVSSGRDVWGGSQLLPLPGNNNDKEIAKLLKDNLKSGPRCPNCNERAHFETVAAKKEHKELKRELAKYT